MNNILEALNGNFENPEGFELPEFNNHLITGDLHLFISELTQSAEITAKPFKLSELYQKTPFQTSEKGLLTFQSSEMLHDLNNNLLGFFNQSQKNSKLLIAKSKNCSKFCKSNWFYRSPNPHSAHLQFLAQFLPVTKDFK